MLTCNHMIRCPGTHHNVSGFNPDVTIHIIHAMSFLLQNDMNFTLTLTLTLTLTVEPGNSRDLGLLMELSSHLDTRSHQHDHKFDAVPWRLHHIREV
jgi:hypothetical protein